MCPVCSKEGDFNTYPNYHIEREIKSSNVYCTNKEKGCEWQGELNYINDHLEKTVTVVSLKKWNVPMSVGR